MIRMIALSFALLFATSAFATEADVTHTFRLKAKPCEVVTWVKGHNDDMAKAAGFTIVKREGDKIRLKANTPGGVFDLTVKETIVKSDSITLKAVMVENHKGSLTKFSNTMVVSPDGDGSKVEIRTVADVDDAEIPEYEMSLVVKASSLATHWTLFKQFGGPKPPDE